MIDRASDVNSYEKVKVLKKRKICKGDIISLNCYFVFLKFSKLIYLVNCSVSYSYVLKVTK